MTLSFWDFVCERHAIYLRRQAGDPPPWTTDPILANYHFTNVYRDLDPGTAFIREQLRVHSDVTLEEKILNVALYRLCLHEESFASIGWWPLPFSGPRWAEKVKAIDKPFHGAYYIHNLTLPIPKADAMSMVGEYLHHWLISTEPDVTSRKAFVYWLSMVKGIGDFIATQVLSDLCYDQHVPLPEDGWVGLGPGALKGLSLVAGAQVEGGAAEAVLEQLWASQPPFEYRLTRMNIQNATCEFSKYHGHPRRRFNAEDRVPSQGSLL